MKWLGNINLVGLLILGSSVVVSTDLGDPFAFLQRRAEMQVTAENATTVAEAITVAEATTATCSSKYVRKEIHQLSSDELAKFHKAMQAVRTKGIYAELCRIHLANVDFAHGTVHFLPWHREIIFRLEKALRDEDEDTFLPYWDWSVESQNPESSIVFTNAYFGGNGRGGCIGGAYSNSGMGCVLRNFDQGNTMGAFAAPELINNILQSRSFEEFWNRMESSPHGNVHNNIGGDMATMSSCKDPFFYLHHAFIDKLWWMWQSKNSNNLMNFAGNLGSNLPPFGKDVRSVMDINDGYCYSYSTYGLVRAASRVTRRAEQNSEESLEQSSDLQAASVAETGGTEATGLENADNQEEVDSKPELQSSSVAETEESSEYLVDPYDRSDILKLRPPNPLPETYLTMAKLDKEKVRQYESENRQIIINLNKDDGYISPICLSRKDSTIKNLINGVSDHLTTVVEAIGGLL